MKPRIIKHLEENIEYLYNFEVDKDFLDWIQKALTKKISTEINIICNIKKINRQITI